MTTIDGKAAWDTLVKKPDKINPLFIEEILFQLEELIFGTDMIGRNAYQLLCWLIRHYKVDPNQGIKEWQTRINQLMDLDKEINNIEGDQLKSLQKKAKKAENALKRS